MEPLGNARVHYWRVIKMSHRCDVDLQKALDAGEIDKSDWGDMVAGCRKCQNASVCDRLVDRHIQRDTAPDFCLNKQMFSDLKRC